MKGKRCGGGAARLPRCGRRNGRRIDRAAPQRFSLGGQQKALLSGHSSTQTASPPLYTLARSLAQTHEHGADSPEEGGREKREEREREREREMGLVERGLSMRPRSLVPRNPAELLARGRFYTNHACVCVCAHRQPTQAP
ncbi:hypothetical protein AOLI_G00000720 [Acnodon oligacanthus]